MGCPCVKIGLICTCANLISYQQLIYFPFEVVCWNPDLAKKHGVWGFKKMIQSCENCFSRAGPSCWKGQALWPMINTALLKPWDCRSRVLKLESHWASTSTSSHVDWRSLGSFLHYRVSLCMESQYSIREHAVCDPQEVPHERCKSCCNKIIVVARSIPTFHCMQRCTISPRVPLIGPIQNTSKFRYEQTIISLCLMSLGT